MYFNKQPTLGSITAYASLGVTGQHLLVSNYALGDGGPDQAMAVFPCVRTAGHRRSRPWLT